MAKAEKKEELVPEVNQEQLDAQLEDQKNVELFVSRVNDFFDTQKKELGVTLIPTLDVTKTGIIPRFDIVKVASEATEEPAPVEEVKEEEK